MLASIFQRIFLKMCYGAAAGAISAKMAGSSIILWAKVTVITSLAEDILYLGVMEGRKYMMRWNTSDTGASQRFEIANKRFTYLYTHAIVSLVEIIALRRLELIARTGTIVTSCYAILRCVIIYHIRDEYF